MEIGGSGTQADPWTIGSSADLAAFAGSSSYWREGTYAVQTADIDMTGVTVATIGNDNDAYMGTFDGGRHTISNVSLSGSESYLGLFGTVIDGTLKNLSCVGFSVTGGDYAGTLVGETNGSIETCSVKNCTIHTEDGTAIGGLAGSCAYMQMTDCFAEDCTLSTAGEYCDIGGMVGTFRGDGGQNIRNCFSYDCRLSTSSDPDMERGGIVGYGEDVGVETSATYGGTHGAVLVGHGSPVITGCYTSSSAGMTSELFHTRGFWDGMGVAGTSYLSWDFTTPVWYWDTARKLPLLQPTVSVPSIRTRISGSWKTIDRTFVKTNGSWTQVDSVFTKIGGSWKQV